MVLTSQLSGKEDIHSMDKMTVMSTDYARLSLKTQNQLRSAVANYKSPSGSVLHYSYYDYMDAFEKVHPK